MTDKNISTQKMARPESGTRWGVVVLLAMGTMVNYIDRVNFGVATPTLMKEFGLGTAEMGILMSAFFWSYALMQLLRAYICERIFVLFCFFKPVF